MYFLQVGVNTIIILTFGHHTLFLSYLWASYFIFVLFLGIILLFVLFLRILVIFRPIFGTPTFICPIFGHPILFGPTSVHPIFCQSYFLLSYLCASYFWDPIFGSSYYCGRLWPVRTSIWDGSPCKDTNQPNKLVFKLWDRVIPLQFLLPWKITGKNLSKKCVLTFNDLLLLGEFSWPPIWLRLDNALRKEHIFKGGRSNIVHTFSSPFQN